jgi:GMP synthase-like glutamine amidotransferase
MLNADTPVPVIHNRLAPTYGRIFHDLLSSAATKTHQNLTIASTDFDAVKNEYPASLDDFDAIIISGSANSAYDDLPWIHKLERWIQEVYDQEPRIKIFGSCFGHQLVCQALLKDYGVTVEKDPKGWELGVKEITLHEKFRKILGKEKTETMRLQFVHHDHVVIPEMQAIPLSWMVVGSTEHCAVQGVYEPGRVLTFQGHFEFDRFVNSETVRFFFSTWQPKILEEALEAIDADDDSVAAAQMVVRFFTEKGEEGESASHAVVGGLLTPPLRE